MAVKIYCYLRKHQIALQYLVSWFAMETIVFSVGVINIDFLVPEYIE